MITINKYSLKQLKRKFDNRDFAIPEIQRQFVWKKPQILRFMDSIFRNYPVGIGLVWYAPFSKAIHIRPNRKTIIPPFNKKAKRAELIIDGQQRLSTLYGVLMGEDEKPEAGSDINFKEIFFNCNKKAANRFIFSKIYDDNTKGFVRLTDLLQTVPSTLRNRLRLNNQETAEVTRCYHSFHNYRFALLQYKATNLNDIREVFIRINSAGMKVRRADTLFAKATDVKLRDHILDIKRGLKSGFENISIESMQSTLGLAYEATRITGRDLETVISKIERESKNNNEFHKKWKKLQYGYEESVDFLVYHLGVTNPFLLPSQNIYSLLAYFFYLNQSRANPAQAREIRKWFWHTACGERYSGAAFNRNIPLDIKFFRRLAKSRKTKYIVNGRITPIDFLRADYRKRSSVSNAYFLLLKSRKPRYLVNGFEMLLENNSSISNRKDRHHIFPAALLRRRQINERWINSICNICYLESDENQSFIDKHPADYLKEFKLYKHFSSVMKGHLIPANSLSPIWQRKNRKGFLDFINARAKMILSEIERKAGTKIFSQFEPLKRI